MTLQNKRCLLVGAGSGIGRAVLDAFETEGAHVAVLERDPDKCASLRAVPDRTVVHGDATSADDVRRALGECERSWGGLDVLVNCVGVFDFYKSLGALPVEALPEAFTELYRVNVLGQLMPARVCLDALRASRGSMIFTLSSSAFHVGRGGVLYVGSKFAIRGTVLALAAEFAPDVRVNGVAPGGVAGTDLRGTAALGQIDQRVPDGPERVRDLENLTPLRIAMRPHEIAPSYVFLASDGSRGMTGTFLHPDGGLAVRG
jgi:NAD(P)-dependent dehydrogenase (short-subunit alcohol dehydrogenase family)